MSYYAANGVFYYAVPALLLSLVLGFICAWILGSIYWREKWQNRNARDRPEVDALDPGAGIEIMWHIGEKLLFSRKFYGVFGLCSLVIFLFLLWYTSG